MNFAWFSTCSSNTVTREVQRLESADIASAPTSPAFGDSRVREGDVVAVMTRLHSEVSRVEEKILNPRQDKCTFSNHQGTIADKTARRRGSTPLPCTHTIPR